MSNHEPLKSYKKVVGPSNRSFGLSFASIFTVLALWPLITRGDSPHFWASAIAGFLLFISIFASKALTPINSLWLELGLFFQKIFSPLIMAILFYIVMSPTGYIMRMLGHDPLRLLLDKNTPSYWIERNPKGPKRGTFNRQY